VQHRLQPAVGAAASTRDAAMGKQLDERSCNAAWCSTSAVSTGIAACCYWLPTNSERPNLMNFQW
jgi:hypothetical protein